MSKDTVSFMKEIMSGMALFILVATVSLPGAIALTVLIGVLKTYL